MWTVSCRGFACEEYRRGGTRTASSSALNRILIRSLGELLWRRREGVWFFTWGETLLQDIDYVVQFRFGTARAYAAQYLDSPCPVPRLMQISPTSGSLRCCLAIEARISPSRIQMTISTKISTTGVSVRGFRVRDPTRRSISNRCSNSGRQYKARSVCRGGGGGRRRSMLVADVGRGDIPCRRD